MCRETRILSLLLLAVLLAGCNWPLAHPETEPLAARSRSLQAKTSQEGDKGYQDAISAVDTPETAPGRSLETSVPAATLPIPAISSQAMVVGGSGLFSGQTLRFDLPAGYQVLEGIDGGCFLYHESLPGFLVLYPKEGEASDTLAGLLNATPGVYRTGLPLEVDLGGLAFTGLFVDTDAGSRLFLAAAGGWALVAQAPAGDWPALASGLNQMLRSLSMEEGF
jgi:hypothetical protein